MNPFTLGAIERTPDERDFPLGAVTPSDVPANFVQDWSSIPVEHQHLIPACGAHAGSFLKDIQETISNASPQRQSPEYLWKRIKLIDGFSPESGTDMLSIFKILKTFGVCDYSLLPNSTLSDLSTYTDPSVITTAMDTNALSKKIGNYAFTFNPTFAEIKQAIYTYKAVLILLRVGKEMWTAPSGVSSWQEGDVLPMRPPQSPVGGHFVVAHSYDDSYIYFRNSWGDTWGRKGDGYFGADYLPFVVEMGTALDFPPGRYTRNLSYGSFGTDVADLQRFLVKNSYGSFIATGFYGWKTTAAVQNLQRLYGIYQTGNFGVMTRAVVNAL